MDELFEADALRPAVPVTPGGGSLQANTTPRRRWRCGCGRAPSTSSSASRSCAPRLAAAPADRGRQGAVAAAVGAARAPGKTTIAAIVSGQTDRRFVEVSAVVRRRQGGAGRDRRGARATWLARGRETVLFVDEVHRFSKAQQDALLPGVENRWVTLVAATTENPFFSVISPLLSRSLLLHARAR